VDLGDALLGAVDVAHVQVDPHLLAHVHPSIYYTYTTICIIYLLYIYNYMYNIRVLAKRAPVNDSRQIRAVRVQQLDM